MLLSVLSSAALPRSSRGSDSPLYLLDDRPTMGGDNVIKKKRAGFFCCTAPSADDVDSDAWVKLRIIEVHSSERFMVTITVDGTHRSDYSSLHNLATYSTAGE